VQFFDRPAEAHSAGYRPCRRCKPDRQGPNPDIDKIRQACEFIDGHIDDRLTLDTIGKEIGLSAFHLQRSFKRHMGISPRQYRDARRMEQFKQTLKRGRNVTESIYEAGYGSSSRLYERAGRELGMTPAAYRNNGAGHRIDFTIVESEVGLMLLAATERGICMLGFGDHKADLERALRDEFRAAVLVPNDRLLSSYVDTVRSHLDGRILDLDLPLDVKATAFQRKVWEELRRIPYGESISYSELAARVDSPRSARAVARACATNPVAIAVPCHRVVHKGRELGGYRWGVERKRKLLNKEANHRPARSKRT
jgi:AraC family transcriptional regulator of adaptative response/methylated-DNA-[protein]-cysteine methyltransferase